MRDPVTDCQLYKTLGCNHVEGFLCEVETCGMLKDFMKYKGKFTVSAEDHINNPSLSSPQVTNYCKDCQKLSERNQELLSALKEIASHVNDWCAAIVVGGTDKEAWIEFYKKACYREGDHLNLLDKMRKVISKGENNG